MEGCFDAGPPPEPATGTVNYTNDEDAENGFSYHKELLELHILAANGKLYEADTFSSARVMEGDEETHASDTITPGEMYEPTGIMLSEPDGKVKFWFRRHDPDKSEAEQDWTKFYGIGVKDIADVFPEFRAFIDDGYKPESGKWKGLKAKIELLDVRNQKVIGRRRRIVQALNVALKERSEEALEERERRLEAARDAYYAKDEKAGMF